MALLAGYELGAVKQFLEHDHGCTCKDTGTAGDVICSK
jgi:hypothetical protein